MAEVQRMQVWMALIKLRSRYVGNPIINGNGIAVLRISDGP